MFTWADPEKIPNFWLFCFVVFFSHQHISQLPVEGVLLDFSLTVKAAPHECVIRTSQP